MDNVGGAGIVGKLANLPRTQAHMPTMSNLITVPDEETPCATRSQPRVPSPSVNGPKTRAETMEYLETFQTPIHRAGLASLRDDAGFSDVQTLYDKVHKACQLRVGIVPAEVRGLLCDSEVFPPSCFRESGCPDDAAGAGAMLEALRDICQKAEESKTLERHEAGWNNLVHTPLLCLVFKPQPPTSVSVRVEPVMKVTIVGDSIPRLQQDSSNGPGSEFALSATASDTSSWGDADSQDDYQVDPAVLHSRSGVKRVDYVLCMALPDGRLKTAISELVILTMMKDGGYMHVNQTAYAPLKKDLIAVSIETKTERSLDDPLVQLGIWTASWHRRLCYLRHEAQRRYGLPHPQRRLVTVPLIQVVGHEWHLYFACFGVSSITVYGPMRMGSTETLLETYALVASLQAIQEWVQTSFFSAMEEWFLCNPSQGPQESGVGNSTEAGTE